MEIKSKVEVKEKGQTANLPTVKQLIATLTWDTELDLDLMAFYKTKNGEIGSVYSNLLGGSLGDLNGPPYMMLSGDAGVGASAGAHSEELKIVDLADIATLNIVAFNYTAAKNKEASASFAGSNGKVTVLDENGNAFEVPLTATSAGTAALICSIDNTSPIGATIKCENTVYSTEDFVTKVEGASVLKA